MKIILFSLKQSCWLESKHKKETTAEKAQILNIIDCKNPEAWEICTRISHLTFRFVFHPSITILVLKSHSS